MEFEEGGMSHSLILSTVRSIQFCNNEILQQRQIDRNIFDLLMAAIACLLNLTQSYPNLSPLIRNSEGIITLVSLLQNDFINPR